MAQPLTPTRFASGLKTLFPEKKLQTYDMEKQPFLNYLPKATDFYGRNAEEPIRYSPGGGGNSHTFEDAQASKGSALYTHFTLTRKRDYKIISIDAEALEASENDKGAYLNAKKSEVDAALSQIIQQLGADLQGNGSGTIATLTAVPVGNTFVVDEAGITRFEPDMRIQSSPSPFTTVRAGAVGYMVVSAVNYDTNTITVDPTQGDSVAVYGLLNGDRIYPKGNFGISLNGTQAWIPTDRSNLATPFNGVVRSIFPSRLAGIFFDGSSYGLAESLERALSRGAKEGCHPDTAWMNYNRFTDLSLELGAKAVRETFKIGEFGYDSIVIHGAGRKVRVAMDQNLEDTTCLITTRDSWKFWTLKSAPRFLTRDGAGDMIIEPARDGYELRIGWRGELVNRSPRDNIRLTLPV
jgi:hypothetical protein